jgi:hypothetical protein
MWEPASFPLAFTFGVDVVEGYLYGGLGICKLEKGWWSLSHLGCGHRIATIKGTVAEAFPIASEIADCTNWLAFEMLDGWRNFDPKLPDKVKAIKAKHRGHVRLDTKHGMGSDPERAREVIAYREGVRQ